MEANQQSTAVPFPALAGAVADLKARLQRDYEQAHPALAEIVHLVLEEEEAKAWELSFPHLFLPDLVEAHIEKLNLQRAEMSHEAVVPHRFAPMAQAAAMSRSVLSTIRQQVGLGEENPSPNIFGPQLGPAAQH